jgi:transcriptional regulator with GAF, ATPase, and Fis domain
LVALIRSNDSTSRLPVIFVSAIFSDEYHHRKGYEAGAVDFMSKPFIPEMLLGKVRVFIELYEQRRKLQSTVDELNRANTLLARRAKQLETSSKVSQQVTAILNMGDLLNEVVRVIESGFGYSLVSIWLVNPAKDMLVPQSTSSHTSRTERQIPVKTNEILSQVYRSGKQHLINDALSNPAPHSANIGLRMVGSELALPLKVQGESLGILDIQSERPQAFAPDDVTALQIIADQVAIAIRNAYLYSQLKGLKDQLEVTVSERTEELRRLSETQKEE